MSKTLNRINQAYTKRLKQLNKDILTVTNNSTGLPVFIECLKHMRDTYIVNKKPMEIIASINVAIEEFEAYKQTKKDFHWNNFCDLIKLNMKEWLLANDTI